MTKTSCPGRKNCERGSLENSSDKGENKDHKEVLKYGQMRALHEL